jgi:ABC-type molybdate transport system substrate-binding protein
MTIQNAFYNFCNAICDAFQEVKQNIKTRTATYAVGLGLLSIASLVTSCGGGDPTPNDGNDGKELVINLIEMISTPTPDAEISRDSIIYFTNAGSTNAFKIRIDLRQNAVGIQVNLAFTGNSPLKSVAQSGSGYDVFLSSADAVKYQISRQDGKPFMQAEIKNGKGEVILQQYNTLEISKVQREKMAITTAQNEQNAKQQFSTFTQAGRVLKGKISELSNMDGVVNTLRVGNVEYKVN